MIQTVEPPCHVCGTIVLTGGQCPNCGARTTPSEEPGKYLADLVHVQRSQTATGGDDASDIAFGYFSFEVARACVRWRSGAHHQVEVEALVPPKPNAGVLYRYGDDRRALLTFVIDVEAASDAEATYRAVMGAFEHELLEWMTVGGKQWVDPHEDGTARPFDIRACRKFGGE